MAASPDNTFRRPTNLTNRDDPAVMFARSYLAIRTTVGVIGIVLPFILIGGDVYLGGDFAVRGSLSAYYHTDMRDYFVGGLCIVGVLLATYMTGQERRPDFWLSLLAGAAVLGVAFLPTTRPGLPADAALCGIEPEPLGCSPVQQQWGELPVAVVHFACAVIFILSLAAICFYFAYRERTHQLNPRMARVQRTCGSIILIAVAWALVGNWVGPDSGPLTPLYLGEVVSVWAFGASWLLNGRAIWRALSPAQPQPDPAA